MDDLKKILVINDRLEGIETALGKAALIEHYTGAEVEVAEVIWDTIEQEPIPDAEKANLIEAFIAADRYGLQKLLKPYQARIAWSEARVLWDKQSDAAILSEAQNQHAGLIIKPAAPHRLGDYLHAPLDWRLIREAPCPVLLSKATAWQTGGAVLAAVDVADEKHRQLSERVLRTGAICAKLLDAQLHVVCAYSDLGQSVNALQVAMDYEGIKEDMRVARTEALVELQNNLGIDNAKVHILEGKASQVIAHLEHEIEPTVTVMGTAARTGLGKLILGNTAEDTLGRLRGDALTVRELD